MTGKLEWDFNNNRYMPVSVTDGPTNMEIGNEFARLWACLDTLQDKPLPVNSAPDPRLKVAVEALEQIVDEYKRNGLDGSGIDVMYQIAANGLKAIEAAQ